MSTIVKQMEGNIGALELKTMQRKAEGGDFYPFKVSGDCMEPTINSGDIVVVDTREKKIKDGLYLIKFPWESAIVRGGLAVRRLQVCFDGIRIIYDNSHYEAEIVQRKDLNIIGRCVGIMKRI